MSPMRLHAMPRSLVAKLLSATLLLIVLALGGAFYLTKVALNDLTALYSEQQRTAGERAVREQAELVVRNLVSSAALRLAGSEYSFIQVLADKTVEENPKVLWVSVIEEATRKPVASTRQAPDVETLSRLSAGAGARPALGTGALRSFPGDGQLIFSADCWVGEQRVGEVHLGFSTRELEEELRAAVARAKEEAQSTSSRQMLVALAVFTLAGFFGMLQAARVARPLKTLTKEVGQIAAGDFERRVEVQSTDEIGELARSFNHMAQSLQGVLAERAGKASLERELEVARSVQKAMSSSFEPFRLGAISVAGCCDLADSCGGDFWCHRILPDGRLLLLIGDVTGHGIPAAMIAATARGAVESLAHLQGASLKAKEILQALDRAVREVGREKLLMTAFALLLDPVTGKLEYGNAGHPFPYLLSMGSAATPQAMTALHQASGSPLGDRYTTIEAAEGFLKPGDVVVLTTDGLTDRVRGDGTRFGDFRLRTLLKRQRLGVDGEGVAALRDSVVAEANRFASGTPMDDDQTLVVLQYVPESIAGVLDAPVIGAEPSRELRSRS